MNSLRLCRLCAHALLLAVVLSGVSGLTRAAPADATPLSDAPPPPDYGPAPPEAPGSRAAAPVAPEGNAPEPEVTIIQRENATFEERRINGRLYQIKVIPKVGPPYYLVDEDGSNVWHRYDSFDTGLHVPRWVIFRF